jgi:hypothetical protein
MHFDAHRPELTWDAQEIVREVDHAPHLLVRLAVRRGYFPHRAAMPFLRIVNNDGTLLLRAWFTEISPPSDALLGYFPVDLPDSGIIEWGYDDDVFGRVPFALDGRRIKRLERPRLAKDVVVTTSKYLEEKRRAPLD